MLRSSWQTVNIGDIGLGEWLFDLDQPDERARIVPTVLAMAKNPTAAKERASQARERVHQRQAETMAVLRSTLTAAGKM